MAEVAASVSRAALAGISLPSVGFEDNGDTELGLVPDHWRLYGGVIIRQIGR